MKEETKIKGFAKLIILVIGLTVCGSGLLAFPNLSNVKVAQASTKKVTLPVDGLNHEIQGIRMQATVQNRIKIYLKAAPIRVTFKNKRWIANRNEIRNWIITNADGTTSVNPRGFINSIAGQVNIVATNEHDGRSVDTNNLTNQINDALNSGRSNRTIALITTVVPRGNGQAGRYNGRYIDVNLSEQRVYAFDGTNQVNSFLVSTGRRGYATPTGEFHIYGKDRSARMHGPGYYLPHVPYISWFSGDYSIHGTYWHHNFGHVMSHGCVNASIADAEWVYNFTNIGTPVYIHY